MVLKGWELVGYLVWVPLVRESMCLSEDVSAPSLFFSFLKLVKG